MNVPPSRDAADAAPAKSFEPAAIEARWYPVWDERGLFRNPPAAKTPGSANAPAVTSPGYCIQLPPPNVTGTLHMGHAFQQTLMDTLIRWQRMKGADTNWVVGTDHAGIATQVVVERQLQAEGKTRHDLGRAAFLDRVWQWKQQSGDTIIGQMRRLGTSANWDYADTARTRGGYFTMDSAMSASVLEVFVQLHEQGLIYRGKRLVNWDPTLQTAVSDLEVDSEEEDGRIWEIRYPLAGDAVTINLPATADEPARSVVVDSLIVATTRPETMLGDTAVAVHPDDPRYAPLVGRRLRLPLSNGSTDATGWREIPIIADDYVDPAFGTGCVKITPAHDFNDYKVGERHGLQAINVLTLTAAISDAAPLAYQGLDRFDARARVLEDLRSAGLLVSEKPHKLTVPRSARTGVIVEPMLTDQWFVAMSRRDHGNTFFPGQSIADVCLKVVADGEVRFVPDHWRSTYDHWMNNIQDWCISRQLWWGHQIPAWYKADDTGAAIHDGTVFVARDEDDARRQAERAGWRGALVRDADVLDTWFSSALVPFTSLGWPNQSPDLARYLPSAVLVTGFDIIFFWVARMVMMTTFFTGKVPFRDVYINAIVRDAEGQKMSKSKGNTIDPLDLIDGITLERLLEKSTVGLLRDDHKARIAKSIRKGYPAGIPAYGADAVRFTFASLATFARTLNFDLNRCEGYRNFCNKLWNATRFVLMQTEGRDCGHAPHTPDQCVPGGYLYFTPVDRWISSQLQRVEASVEAALSEYRFDNAAREIYEFVWNNYCDWYLELAKVNLASPDEAVQRATRRTLLSVLETILRLAHPIIPFITEELWQKVAPLANRYGEPGQAPLTGAALDEAIAQSRFSIMSQRYPVSQPGKIDPVSEAIVAELRQMIDACRALRGEMTISPAVKLPLVIAGNADRIALHAPYLQALAKLSGVVAVEALPQDSISPVQIVGDFRLMLQVEIDVGAERDRLEREIERVRTEVNRAQGKLGNAGFVDRAPPAVVAQERERLGGFETTLARLIEQRGKLG